MVLEISNGTMLPVSYLELVNSLVNVALGHRAASPGCAVVFHVTSGHPFISLSALGSAYVV